MTSVSNLDSNSNDLIKKKSKKNSATEYTRHKYDLNTPTPALSQGSKYKKYQSYIAKDLEKNASIVSGKEGYVGLELNKMELSPNGLAMQSNDIIRKNDYSSQQQQQTIQNLNDQYNQTLQQYETLLAEVSGSSTSYINRVSPDNPYLGKYILFPGNYYFYVTQQGVAKVIPASTSTLDTFDMISGKNGCPASTEVVTMSIPWNESYLTPGTTIPTTPTLLVGTPMVAGQSCGNEGTNIFVNTMINNPSANYEGCFADNATSPLMTFVGGIPPVNINLIKNGNFNEHAALQYGSYTYEQCQQYAVDNAYQYFALQDVNPSTNIGYCAVSNSQITAQSLGTSYVESGMSALWNSNTAGPGAGGMASLNGNGALTVSDSSGKVIFSTPKPDNPSTPSYLGCYGDNPNRAMPLYNDGSQQYDNQQCQQIAAAGGYAYYGLQNSSSGTNAQCGLSNDFNQATEYGLANNCTQLSDGSWSGGGWSNAVYNTTLPQSNYYVIVEDDANVSIYKGTGPTDNQGLIWSTNTSGQQNQANPAYSAKNSKFGQNWMSSGSSLATGEFIGSPSGYAVLIMQTDGNLVLYNFAMSVNCQKMSNGNMGGGVGANALYNLGEVGNTSNLNQLAYIDQNAELHAYPSNNKQYNNSYNLVSSNTNSFGNDIQNGALAYGNATVDQCKSTCNNLSDCAGFIFADNVCWPKTSNFYPSENMYQLNNCSLYTRNQEPINTPVGVPHTTNNTDTIIYGNYADGGPIGNQYGIANATSLQKQQLDQLQSQLNLLSSQIANLTGEFSTGSNKAENQVKKNVFGVSNYLTDLYKNNQKIKTYPTHIDNILKDSDIVVLKKNYDYLFWTILAVGTLLISINLTKK
jgi:hypothetical protein